VDDETEPSAQELRIAQTQREREESERAKHAELPEEEHTAERRSDKAGYLRSKLEEQEAADEERS